MKYQLSTGEILTGKTCEDIVIGMKGHLWESELSLPKYMQKVSERVKIQSSHTVRYDTAENLIEDLVTAQYLIALND